MTEVRDRVHEEKEEGLSTADMATAAGQRTKAPAEARNEPTVAKDARVTPNAPGPTETRMEPATPPRTAEAAAAPKDARQPAATPRAPEANPPPLFLGQEAQELRTVWGNIQTAFVDNPRQAVE